MNRDRLNQKDANALNDMSAAIGAFNVIQGWRKRGDSIRAALQEHAPELVEVFTGYQQMAEIALIHSELSEALEGVRKGLFDDHLPHRTTLEVEMGDVQIRTLDFSNHWGLDLGNATVEKAEYNRTRADHKFENRMAQGGKKF